MSKESKEEEQKIDESSILFKPLFLIILVVLLLIAIWFRFYTIIGIVFFLLTLTLFISIWKKIAIKQIELDIVLPKMRLFVGESFNAHLSLKNNKIVPLVWVELAFKNSNLVTWGEEKKPFYLVRLLWLLA